MYLYYREYNFWGGWGIVGMILFFGVGFVFGQKYEKKFNVIVVIYGDGVGNQVFSF